jgi:hypothetical protein
MKLKALRSLADLAFVPVIHCPFTSVTRYGYLALVVALIVATAYIGLVVTIDDTNLGTTNGLWKSPDVFAWGHGANQPFDTGEMLYTDAYGHLARLIPDALLQYGVPPPDVTFRKMAILNAIFGGVASGLVFLLAVRFTDSAWVATVVSLVHAGAGFVLLNSINSEDIIPAYTFLVGAVVCFFEFQHRGGFRLFVGSALLMALATLFHWTVMVPGVAAFGAVYLYLLPRGRLWFLQGAAWLFAFAASVQALILLAFPFRHIPVWYVLYPAKAQSSGWVGLFGEKLWYLLVGTGNYLSGANNLASYRMAFENSSILHSMILSWTVLAIALATCVGVVIRRPANSVSPLLAVFALALFAVGEAGAVYSQPQDPQMQIEPMFATIPGLILLARQRTGSAGILVRRCAITGLVVIGTVNGAWNTHLMTLGSGQDSKAIAAMTEFNRLFPKGKTLIVSHGFEGWMSWEFVLLWHGDSKGFIENGVHLARPFTIDRGITGADAAAIVCKQIDAALAEGRRVVAAAVWTMPSQEIIDSLTTVTSEADARVYVSILRKKYRTGMAWDTSLGRFVELVPAT